MAKDQSKNTNKEGSKKTTPQPLGKKTYGDKRIDEVKGGGSDKKPRRGGS